MYNSNPLFSSIRILPSHYWPQVEDGIETFRFEAHPIIKWLAKWFPITPYVEMERMKYKDSDPIFDESTGSLLCSYAQADYLRRTYRG